MRRKLYVALCGLPDCGKSTFIKNFVKYVSNRDVSIDSLCDEEKKEMTIRSAQITCRCMELDYDFVFLDCPGHLELIDEIKSCLTKADVVIILNNAKDYYAYSESYKNKICDLLNSEDITTYNEGILGFIEAYSHLKDSDLMFAYDIDDETSTHKAFNEFVTELKRIAENSDRYLKSPLTAAKRVMMQTVKFARNPAAMISYGKDSIVMLAIAYELGIHKQIKWYYPVSGFDMDGLSSDFIKEVNNRFEIECEPYRVIPDEPHVWNFENKSVQEMMLKKAEMLNVQIAKNNHDFCLMGIRRDEEGVRAKEKFFSVRKNDGSANLYEQQFEPFEAEISAIACYEQNKIKYKFDIKNEHVRVHPLLDVSEADAWLYIKENKLPFCSEYIAIDGKRFRSLGDKPITSPISSNAATIDEIVHEVCHTLIPERACRAAQDNAVKGNMEIIRSKGFF